MGFVSRGVLIVELALLTLKVRILLLPDYFLGVFKASYTVEAHAAFVRGTLGAHHVLHH
jgi:hypothetical protein